MSTTESDIVSRIAALNAPQEPASEPAAGPAGPDPTDAGIEQPTAESAPAAEPGDEGEPAGAAADAVEEIEIGDLNDLAAHLGVDPAELYNIAVPYTSEGGKKEFTLGELKDKYQRFEEAESIRVEAQTRLEAYQQAEAQAQELIQAHALHAEGINRALEAQLLADFQGVNWQHLQATNPGEYIRQQQIFQNRQAQIQQRRAESAQFVEQQTQAIQTQRETLQQQRLLREQQALLKAIPEWRDQSVADAERQELARYMISNGYSEDEINAVDDHRAILLVRDAMRYRQMQSAANVAAKKVVKLAKKVVSPGSRQTPSEANTDAERGLRTSLRKTGSTQDAAALIAYRMGRKK